MGVFNLILGVPLGFIMYFAYSITGSYIAAILIFAVVTRALLFPVSILTHRNSIRLLQIQPALNILKKRYAGDKEQLSEEQYNLFKNEKYSPLVGLIPLFIQLFLIIGVMQVMYNQLQHLFHFNKDVIDALLRAADSIYGPHSGLGEQLRVPEALSRPGSLPVFQSALAGFPDADDIIQKILSVDMNFFGLSLSEIPSFSSPSPALIIPFVSGFTALIFCLVQNAISPGALSQNKATNTGLIVFNVALSFYFALVTPISVGIYWSASNILMIISVFILRLMYDPKKLAGDAIEQIKAARKTPAQLREERIKAKQMAAREKQDAARFQNAEKKLVFYALTGGQYKFYKKIIEYLLDNSDAEIHYLTNDYNDAVLDNAHGRLIAYYAGQRKTISLMLRLDTDIFVTTVPDLQTYHMKRSVVRDDIEYIYLFHALASMHLTLREASTDYFDTVFCVGEHHIAEIRRREELAGLPKKNLVKAGYGLYDQLIESYAAMPQSGTGKPQILIAPSWQDKNIFELCIDDILQALSGRGYKIIVRPHPQYVRLFPEQMRLLTERYPEDKHGDEIFFELDFSGNESIYLSDIVITDWSNIALEFSYCTLKPSIFINTPMKVMNPDYERFGLVPLEISLRDEIGVSVDTDRLGSLNDVVTRLLSERDAYKEQIQQVVGRYLFYPGRSGEAGGKYILSKIGSFVQ